MIGGDWPQPCRDAEKLPTLHWSIVPGAAWSLNYLQFEWVMNLGTVKLETPRLILRRFTLDDVQHMYDNWAGDDEVTKFLVWPTHADLSASREVIKIWLAGYDDLSQYIWCLESKTAHQAEGEVTIKPQPGRGAGESPQRRRRIAPVGARKHRCGRTRPGNGSAGNRPLPKPQMLGARIDARSSDGGGKIFV